MNMSEENWNMVSPSVVPSLADQVGTLIGSQMPSHLISDAHECIKRDSHGLYLLSSESTTEETGWAESAGKAKA
ncbi:hypothetical protein LY78DRAFT_161186, partial [Colletotrichum sublineola]